MVCRSALTILSPSLQLITADLTGVIQVEAAVGAEDGVLLEGIAEGGGTPGRAAPLVAAG